jgi:hypothetical protein
MHFPDIDVLIAAAESGEDMGFCVKCGAEAYGVEPDARKYECDECGAEAVYGVEELLLRHLMYTRASRLWW